MKDYTVGVNELRDHYNQLRLFKKSVRAQVKMEYEAKIDFEIKSRTEAEELKFANHLAAVKERDNMPVRVIQDEVIRTRTWSVWERIRDLAGVVPEFVRAEDVREAKRLANAPFRWEVSDDNKFGFNLVLTRDEKGELIEPEVTLTDIRIEADGKLSAWPNIFGENTHEDVWNKHWDGRGEDMKAYATRIANQHRNEAGQ